MLLSLAPTALCTMMQRAADDSGTTASATVPEWRHATHIYKGVDGLLRFQD